MKEDLEAAVLIWTIISPYDVDLYLSFIIIDSNRIIIFYKVSLACIVEDIGIFFLLTLCHQRVSTFDNHL